jgi:transposase
MTRKKWSPEEKQKIILAGLRNEASIAELCRHHGVSNVMYYKWKKTFLEGALNGLKGNGTVSTIMDKFIQINYDILKI